MSGAARIQAFQYAKAPGGAVHFHWNRTVSDQTGMDFGQPTEIRSWELLNRSVFGLLRSDTDMLLYFTKGTADAVVVEQSEVTEFGDLRPVRGLLLPSGSELGLQAHNDRVAFSLVIPEGAQLTWRNPLDEALALPWLDPQPQLVITEPMANILAAS